MDNFLDDAGAEYAWLPMCPLQVVVTGTYLHRLGYKWAYTGGAMRTVTDEGCGFWTMRVLLLRRDAERKYRRGTLNALPPCSIDVRRLLRV
jgi:hypothetical protein